MIRIYHKRLLTGLIMLMLVFGLLMIVTFANLGKHTALLGMGIPILWENWLIIILCLVGLIKAFVEIIRLEHPHELTADLNTKKEKA